MINKLLLFIAVAVIIVIFISFLQFYISIKPPRYVSIRTPEDLGLRYENFSVKTSDGISISGWSIPAKARTNRTIIISHGYPFDKGNIAVMAPFLHEKFNIVLFDFRYFGSSSGSYSTLGYDEQKDLTAVIGYLERENKNQKIGVFGFSLGASTAIMAAASDSRIRAVVADSPYASIELMTKDVFRAFIFTQPFEILTRLYGKLFLGIDSRDISPLKSIKDANAPVLLIHGQKDSQIPARHSRLLKEAQPNAELWIVEEADHGYAYYEKGKEYEDKVVTFFEKHLN
ncbi:alpha/beta fold hydrolase [Candidatus Woesearchaeota archaeon]|nr:alpha/beta fold hydrolase [Candidatus Woesearchaeota archaeon]